jgi:hypothetical protein
MREDDDPLAGLDPLAHGGELPMADRERILMQRQINALLISDRLLAQQMAELAQRVGRFEATQQTMASDFGLLREELKANTEVTVQVRDLLTTARGLRKVGDGIAWLAKLVTACALLWAALLAALHFKPPQG